MDKLVKCATCLYNKNCQFLGTHKNTIVEGCTAYKDATNMVKVVRCEQCELFVDNKQALVQYCKRECKNLTVKPNDFCSYGKRKEGAEE